MPLLSVQAAEGVAGNDKKSGDEGERREKRREKRKVEEKQRKYLNSTVWRM
jgi:hypothetical protein